MTAPTTGEREPDAISEALDDLEHAVKCEYASPNVHPAMQRKFDRDMSIVADARNAYVALRAEIARVTAERDEDRRDYAADTAMAVACIEALREVRPEWESLFYATEDSKMEECAAFTIRQLAEQLATAQREAAGLREAASAVLGYVIDGVVACHGDKCRELNCESCYLEENAADYVARARIASNTLRQALTPAPEARR